MWIRILILIMISVVSLSIDANTGFANSPEVRTFIKQMVKKHHFNETKLIALFSKVELRPIVMQKVRYPLEQRPWHTYQMLFVTEWRIRKGIEFWNQYQDFLKQVEKKYGVPASIIVATIGIETKYGAHTGEYPVIDALANIAFSDSPRAPFFRHELEEFLLLTKEKHLDPLKVMGSYAGAIGQPQFMPSSYRRYAVSHSSHSKIDLSNNELDVIASIANYYKQKGWQTGQPIAAPASLVSHQYRFLTGNKQAIPLSTFNSKNTLDQAFKVIELRNYWGNEYWLGFHNFDVIKRYNASDLYAMAVFQLSHYIEIIRKDEKNA